VSSVSAWGEYGGVWGQDCSWLFTVDSGKGRFRRRESLFESAAKNPEQKTRLQREIESTDRQIDQLVYELYGLTEGGIMGEPGTGLIFAIRWPRVSLSFRKPLPLGPACQTLRRWAMLKLRGPGLNT